MNIITKKCRNINSCTFNINLLFIMLFALSPLKAQMAKDHCKFFGNIIASSIPDTFPTYWNQVTPENSGKWGSVEKIRDTMSWSGLDLAYNYAIDSGYPFKQHNFVWGQQQPSWIAGITQEEQKEEVEEWISLYGERYSKTASIDVVNEPLHAAPSYKAALGGDGTTGWDWVIWTFERARQYCPNAKLILNDYGIINSNSATDQYLEIIYLLKERGLIDAIGEQGHGFEYADTSKLHANLNKLAATGLPIYISEYDVNTTDDAEQLAIYKRQIPMFWEHPAVKGITLWGYIQDHIWKKNAYLIRADGTERPALTWLKTYISQSDKESLCQQTSSPSFSDESGCFITPNPAINGIFTIHNVPSITTITITDCTGQVIKEQKVNHQESVEVSVTLKQGLYLVILTNGQHTFIKKIMVM